MSDGYRRRSDDHFFDQQSDNPMPFGYFHRLRPRPQACLKRRKALYQVQEPLLIGNRRFERL